MTVKLGSWPILIANVLIPVAIIAFSSGFFPYKPLLPGLATFEGTDVNSVAPRIFDKVIFMVIDALRSDFVYSNTSGFHFTQSLIRSGAALPFTAHAGSPTVTMPRLKAMTTGSVPSFLDVILNIAESDTSSTLAYQDTWLAQLKAQGGQLVMYGDDTWLKLFPEFFSRSDGTTSFFVSDFTEVDNNVTRHVPRELSESDWSAFIMHFLGLDHIGHKAGPKSPYMITKQREMDSIVAQIYEAMEEKEHLQSTLFVLCGDHGMNDAGNHGGSSPGETSPALLLISPKFREKQTSQESPVEAFSDLQYYRTVEQMDITPTLAGLLGLPIPVNSLGVFIPELLMMWNDGPYRIDILLRNAKQLVKTMEAAYPGYSFEANATALSCNKQKTMGIASIRCAWFQALQLLHQAGDSRETLPELESAFLNFSRSAQEVMSSTASNYDLTRLYMGLGVMALAVSLSLVPAYKLLLKSQHPGLFLMLSILGYGGMMFASSYVEEEQQFWYWLVTAWTVYLHLKSFGYRRDSQYPQAQSSLLIKCTTVGLAISYRILRRWNQTGQKFAADPDIARNFFPSHQNTLWALILLTYVDTSIHLCRNLPPNNIWRLAAISTTITAFFFKLVFVVSDSPELLDGSLLAAVQSNLDGATLVTHARLVLFGIALLMLTPIYMKNGIKREFHGKRVALPSTVFHESLTLFLITQSRAANIPVFLLFRLQASILASMNLTPIELTITSLLSQYMTFFAFGGSNAISSVDISNSYNGIGSYSVVLVGILTFISNWAGPIWWVSATRLLRSNQTCTETKNHITLLTFHVATSFMFVMAACTALRTHLFIWTVFSPKYLYTLAWTILNHLVVNLLGAANVSLLLG